MTPGSDNDSGLTCLGDGHDGVWNLVAQMSPAAERREVLDWYHLVENLNKVGGSIKRINHAEALLWQGKVEQVLTLFEPLKKKAAKNFCQYLRKHRHRIINYDYYQREQICSIGSGRRIRHQADWSPYQNLGCSVERR